MDVFYLDSQTRKAAYSPGYINHRAGEALAVGRYLSKTILDQLNWRLWNPATKKGIDAHARDVLSTVNTKSHHFRLTEEELMICDVKGEDSLSNFVMYPHWAGIDPKYITKRIPELNGLI
jgi:hypothetical protein